ncbi:hypothetical protein DFH28DRAFT_1082625 [Melampsora americana]|nr:hypothetical protein DFH28DRAFT_1082625 [Melampsora americana]
MNSNAEQEIEALHANSQWTLTAKTTKDILHSECPYSNILLPVMGDCPSNKPLYAAEAGIITWSSTKNNSSSSHLSPAKEMLATQYTGWDPTQSINHDKDALPDTLDNTLPKPEDRPRTSSGHLIQAQTQSHQPDCRSQLHTNPITDPPASQSSYQSTNNISRRTSRSSSFPKLIQTLLPSHSDIKEMNNNNKQSNEPQGLMIEKIAANNKHTLEEDNLTPEAIARRKAKEAKQDDLELMKLERELAQERKALEVHSRVLGMSKIDVITKLAAVNIPYAEVKQMADAVIESLQKDA